MGVFQQPGREIFCLQAWAMVIWGSTAVKQVQSSGVPESINKGGINNV
jgi:tetrahydromethanopterin S-methyltransferase subunit C